MNENDLKDIIKFAKTNGLMDNTFCEVLNKYRITKK